MKQSGQNGPERQNRVSGPQVNDSKVVMTILSSRAAAEMRVNRDGYDVFWKKKEHPLHSSEYFRVVVVFR
jgi:hypothetical protein